jgi:hypothetical protein
MSRQQPTAEDVTVRNNLTTVPDSQRAIDLFARILAAVRRQREADAAGDTARVTALVRQIVDLEEDS